MSYRATAIKVMIASPSDVPQERQLIRDVIQEWNAINSESTNLVLMPIGWETHSSPAMGAPAQDIVNKQVLEGCDLLVASFWTRIGSPTGEAPSGTVEEIRKHLDAGRPAMVYFSSAPVRPDSIDEAQYAALKEFREECRKQGLVETYDSLSEFREKFSRQLAQTIIRRFSQKEAQEGSVPGEPPQRPDMPDLSDAAKELLMAASEDRNGTLMKVRTFGGLIVQANRREFGEKRNPRSEALMEGAVKELCELGLLEPRGQKGEVFGVTQEGYTVADRLRKEAGS